MRVGHARVASAPLTGSLAAVAIHVDILMTTVYISSDKISSHSERVASGGLTMRYHEFMRSRTSKAL